jgi:hypothetical protein
MAKFRLRDRVRRTGQQEVRTVEEIRENPSAETMYWIQLGSDFATRVWANESELEPAAVMLDVSVPPIAGSDKVGVVPGPANIDIPAHERCLACGGSGLASGVVTSLTPKLCPACHGTGKKS